MAKFRMAVSYKNRDDPTKRPPLPPWLERIQNNPGSETISSTYWLKIYWATPPWLTEEHEQEMKAIHEAAKEGEHVDHIVPLKHPDVCGLHVPWNLQILPEKPNLYKSNHFWPGMFEHTLDMFGNRWDGSADAL